jgi:hypothetical protein
MPCHDYICSVKCEAGNIIHVGASAIISNHIVEMAGASRVPTLMIRIGCRKRIVFSKGREREDKVLGKERQVVP